MVHVKLNIFLLNIPWMVFIDLIQNFVPFIRIFVDVKIWYYLTSKSIVFVQTHSSLQSFVKHLVHCYQSQTVANQAWWERQRSATIYEIRSLKANYILVLLRYVFHFYNLCLICSFIALDFCFNFFLFWGFLFYNWSLGLFSYMWGFLLSIYLLHVAQILACGQT